MNDFDDEMFDDLHEGVEALKAVWKTHSLPLTKKAAVTLERLESALPAARIELRLWKRRLKEGAIKVAQRTDAMVREHPWLFTLSALGLGLLAGVALAGSGDEEENR